MHHAYLLNFVYKAKNGKIMVLQSRSLLWNLEKNLYVLIWSRYMPIVLLGEENILHAYNIYYYSAFKTMFLYNRYIIIRIREGWEAFVPTVGLWRMGLQRQKEQVYFYICVYYIFVLFKPKKGIIFIEYHVLGIILRTFHLQTHFILALTL